MTHLPNLPIDTDVLAFAQGRLDQAHANDAALHPAPAPLPDTAETVQRAAADAFLARIPRDLPDTELALSPCGDPACFEGWVSTPEGTGRCPKCAALERTARLAEQYSRAGVEGTLYHLTWADVKVEHGSWRLSQALGQNMRDVLRDCINVAMVGLKGRGKTQAGVLLAKDAIDAGHSALVVSWAEWVDEVQSDYTRRTKTQAEHVAALSAPDLLVLDDVGAGASSEGALERKLFTRVISARYNRRRPTVITANLTKKELEAAMGDRAFDRIQHACEWIVFDGPAYRAEVEHQRVQSTLDRIRKAAGL